MLLFISLAAKPILSQLFAVVSLKANLLTQLMITWYNASRCQIKR